MPIAVSKPEGFCVPYIRECWNLTNIIPCASFETNNVWGGIVYDTSQKLYGSRSSKLSGTTVNTVAMPTPTLNHVYYGRHSFKTAGNATPADCRFEWYAGDGAGLNFVFGWNTGNRPNWYTESAVIKVTQLSATSGFICRNFVVNTNYDIWSDGLMIVDLTEGFGAGNEPSKEWCDANIPFFEGDYELRVTTTKMDAAECQTPAFIEDSTIPRFTIGKSQMRANNFRECITIKNLLSDGDFSNNGWGTSTNIVYDTAHVKYGTKAMKVTATTASPEVTFNNLKAITLRKDHIYFGRVETYQTAKCGGTGMYWPIAEPSMGSTPNNVLNAWEVHGFRVIRSAWNDNTSWQLRLDYDNGYAAGTIWFDGAMLVDLTETFGAGYEPTGDWCINNIPFALESVDIMYRGATTWQH